MKIINCLYSIVGLKRKEKDLYIIELFKTHIDKETKNENIQMYKFKDKHNTNWLGTSVMRSMIKLIGTDFKLIDNKFYINNQSIDIISNKSWQSIFHHAQLKKVQLVSSNT